MTDDPIVCRTCGGDAQPADNFYVTGPARTNRRRVCKLCVLKDHAARRKAKIPGAPDGRLSQRMGKDIDLSPLDLVQCPYCWLRGHVPLDPEKCSKTREPMRKPHVQP